MSDLKKEIKNILHPENKMLEVVVERLHPPMAPTKSWDDSNIVYGTEQYEKEPIVSETSDSGEEGLSSYTYPKGESVSKLAIDFNNLDPKYQKWCVSLETQRHYYYTKFGKVHRKDKIEVKKDLKIKDQELDMINYMKRNKYLEYKECMKELELKLQEKRVE